MSEKKIVMKRFGGVTQTRAPMAPLRFLHAADLHLGLGCGPTDAIRQSRRRAGLEAFFALLDLAAEQQVHLVLLAGDLLEEAVLHAQDKRIIRSALESCPCPVVFLPGNHDPIQGGSWYQDAEFWPESTVCFGTQWTGVVFPQLRLRIWGAGFARRRQERSCLPGGSVSDWLCEVHSELSALGGLSQQTEGSGETEPSDFEKGTDWCDIGLLHGEVVQGGSSLYNPLSPQDLVQTGLQYIALGHIHRPSGLCDADHPRGRLDTLDEDTEDLLVPQKCNQTCWCYAGCPVGNGFDECGPRGFYAVEWTPNQGVVATFCPSHQKEFRQLALVVPYREDPRSTAQEVLAQLAALQSDYSDHYYRLIWTGAWPADAQWPLSELEHQLRPHFAYLQTRDRTRTLIEISDLASERSLRGRAIRKALEALENADEAERLHQEHGLRLLLAAFEGDLSDGEAV